MKFNVPYYAQTSEFTCGPACVVMVMKHFDPRTRTDRYLEFEIWRQCNMIGVRGADPYGLSVPLLNRGYQVFLVTRRKKTVNYPVWKRAVRSRFSIGEIELSLLGMSQNQRKALNNGLNVQYKRPVVADIVRKLRDGIIPIALVHMGVVHGLNIPHWVVVTGADDRKVVFNDPYPPKGRKGLWLSHAKFQKILDDIRTKIGFSPSVLYVRRSNA